MREERSIGVPTSTQPNGQAFVERILNYSYDSQQRLNQIEQVYTQQNINRLTTYAYDDNGNRVKKESNGNARYYVVSAPSSGAPRSGLVISELNGSGDLYKTLVAGAPAGAHGGMDTAIAEVTSTGTISYLQQDVLDSTTLQSDESGTTLQTFTYDAFGAVNPSANGGVSVFLTTYLYTGQEMDTESDLVYMNARYYNPQLGRFLVRDPALSGLRGQSVGTNAGDVLLRNPYIYALNNPLRYTDPTGESAKAIDLVMPGEDGERRVTINLGTNEIAGWREQFQQAQATASEVLNTVSDFLEGTNYAIKDNFTLGASSALTESPPNSSAANAGLATGDILSMITGAVLTVQGIIETGSGGTIIVFSVTGSPVSGGASLIGIPVGTAITAEGLAKAGYGAVVLIRASKKGRPGGDGRSKNREVQQKQVNSLRKELEKKGVDVEENRRVIHDILHEGNYSYKDARKVLFEHFNLN